jgi:hypothetical protein
VGSEEWGEMGERGKEENFKLLPSSIKNIEIL